MCWNQTVSLNTFIFGLFAVTFAYSNNVLTLYESLYYMSFISMQLVEYFTWKHLDNKTINRLMSQSALLLILIQFPLLLLAYENSYTYLLISLYMGIVLYEMTTHTFDFSMTKAANGHLQWNWNVLSTFFYCVYFILGGILLLYTKQYALFTFLLITIIVSRVTCSNNNKTIGSMWCWLVNGIAFYLICKVFYKEYCTLPNGTLF